MNKAALSQYTVEITLKTITICAIILFSSVAFAQSQRTPGQRPPVEKSRQDQKILFVGWSPFGVHIPTYLTRPYNLGLYVKDYALVGLEYGSVSLNTEFGDHKAKASYTNMGVYARLFSGFSLNYLFAIHKRNFEGEITTTLSGQEYSVVAKTEAQVATIGLGNQWKTDFGLVLGVDWGVFSKTLASSSTVEVKAESISDSDRKSLEEDGEELADYVNTMSALPGFLILTLGWAF